MPKVSVIIPTYNRAHYIRETIDSVLAQTYPDYEIIVVDDGSTDKTAEVLKHYNGRIRYYCFPENKGISAARNFAIEQARGKYIAFLDDDDLWMPEKLEKQVAVLENNPELAFVCSGAYVIDAHGEVTARWCRAGAQETFECLYDQNFVLNLTVILRRECFAAVGGFDPKLPSTQDYDLWLRLAKRYKFSYVDSCLAKYRLHPQNLSKNIDRRLRQHLMIINKKEICQGLGFWTRRIRMAKAYYYFAGLYLGTQGFRKAGMCYFKALLICPFIGGYYWPKEAWKFRFSLPYRIFKVYFEMGSCFVKLIKTSKNYA